MKLTCIAFVGSSSVYGEADTKEGGYVNRIHKRIVNQHLPVRIYNLGIPGESTDDILHRVPIELSHRKPTLVVLHVGTNDTAHHTKEGQQDITLEDFEKNTRALISMAKKIATDVLVLTPSPVDDKKNPHLYGTYFYNKDIKEYAERLSSICEEENVSYINLYKKFSRLFIKRYLHSDGLHLNANGHEHVKKWVIKKLNELYKVSL